MSTIKKELNVNTLYPFLVSILEPASDLVIQYGILNIITPFAPFAPSKLTAQYGTVTTYNGALLLATGIAMKAMSSMYTLIIAADKQDSDMQSVTKDIIVTETVKLGSFALIGGAVKLLGLELPAAVLGTLICNDYDIASQYKEAATSAVANFYDICHDKLYGEEASELAVIEV